jgi:hypothetical protein
LGADLPDRHGCRRQIASDLRLRRRHALNDNRSIQSPTISSNPKTRGHSFPTPG